ncbi:MAG: alpha-L-fucosidase [Verrucomicrobiales bacterium]|jgi:alpha-L-fucosidase|nr:alpha-L-fucosidase [Verrucomicrobiales bacterium]
MTAHHPVPAADRDRGAQRLTPRQLQDWEALRYGMFIHCGINAYDGTEHSLGRLPPARYAPDRLDIDQWICAVRDAGMRYAVLTAKHDAGFCLWPSRHTDYHVGNSGNRTDVVAEFVRACERRGVRPGLYYCSWDNHHRFGSVTPSDPVELRRSYGDRWAHGTFTTPAYHEFQLAQLEELLTGYGKIAEVWIDIPAVLPRHFRARQYAQIAAWQPDAVIVANNGMSSGAALDLDQTWPTDVITIERDLPPSQPGYPGHPGRPGHLKWRDIEGRRYYLPGEVCDTISREWFHTENDPPRDDAELLGMWLTATARGANFLLNVPVNLHGLLPECHLAALQRLRRNIDRLG